MAKKHQEPFEKIHESRKSLLINNFLGGIAWGIGSTLGLALILGIVGFILKQIDVIPFVGSFVTEITKYVHTHQ